MPAMPAQAPSSLLTQLRALPGLAPEAGGGEAQAYIKAWRQARIAALTLAFEAGNNAPALLGGLSGTMDEIISALHALLLPGPLGVAVVATGGYGRSELFPYSDIDLLILYRPATRLAAERMARTLFYLLWDLGLKVGHALRGVEETLDLAREDITIRTNLLDARLVAGDADLFAELTARFQREIVEVTAEEFVERKLAEREDRHKRFGDSRFLLEPNIKEGKGGLRDLHTIHWLARYVYGVREVRELVERGLLEPEEYTVYEKARALYAPLRAHLHLAAGKAEERLTFDRQQALSRRMGFTGRSPNQAVERLMRRYFLAAAGVGSLTRILCALLEDEHKRTPRQPLALRMQQGWKLGGFVLEGERLSVKNEDEFTRDPSRMLALFAAAQAEGLDIHPHALRLLARALPAASQLSEDSRANTAFLDILCSPRGSEQTLRRMNEIGLLGRFIPEFGRIVGQMQFNMYHIYTVDEHIIVALGILHNIEHGRFQADMPLATELMKRVASRRVLYVSLLCHDIAKGRGGDHSALGAEIALKLARRFGLKEDEAQLAGWLVQHHLLFTETAFKRDASDPQTIRDFAASVQSVERLRLLLILTAADMRAVGPGVWNAWKAALLRNLYARTEDYLLTGRLISGEQERQALRAELLEHLPFHEEMVDAYLALGETEYIEALDAEAHARLVSLVRRVEQEGLPLALDARHDAAHGVTELTVIAPDSHALFSKLAGAISLVGANIAGARIYTLKNGMAVDIFQLQDAEGKTFERPDALSRLAVKMEQTLNNSVDLPRELARQRRPFARAREAFEVPPQVYVENEASSTHTVIEVVGRDRVGFLHAVTRALSEAGLTIASAHISTYGVQAVDVFYVKDPFGFKITHNKKLRDIREALLAAIDES